MGHLHLTPFASSLETPTTPKSKPNSIIRISNWCKVHSPTSPRSSVRSKAYGAHCPQTASTSTRGGGPHSSAWRLGADPCRHRSSILAVKGITYRRGSTGSPCRALPRSSVPSSAKRATTEAHALPVLGGTNTAHLAADGRLATSLAWLVATDRIPQNDHAVPEPALIEQLQLQPHTIGEEPFSGAEYHRKDDHVKFVNKTSS